MEMNEPFESFELKIVAAQDFMDVITRMREIQEIQGLPDDTPVIVDKAIFTWSVPTETLDRINGNYYENSSNRKQTFN